MVKLSNSESLKLDESEEWKLSDWKFVERSLDQVRRRLKGIWSLAIRSQRSKLMSSMRNADVNKQAPNFLNQARFKTKMAKHVVAGATIVEVGLVNSVTSSHLVCYSHLLNIPNIVCDLQSAWH